MISMTSPLRHALLNLLTRVMLGLALALPALMPVRAEIAITLDKGKPNSVFHPDGTAFIIHAGKDDYKTDPTGDAGGRIACGIIQ